MENSAKLYIKQHYKTIKEKYNVYDDESCENVIYYCEGEYKSWGSKIRMYDSKSKELLFVIGELIKWQFHRRFQIHDSNDKLLATIKQKSTFKSDLEIKIENGSSNSSGDGKDKDDETNTEKYLAKGDFMGFNFQILNNGLLIGTVTKKKLTWGDSYQLEISNGFSPSFFAAFVIVIDDCFFSNKNLNL